jgi:hypothetical protein
MSGFLVAPKQQRAVIAGRPPDPAPQGREAARGFLNDLVAKFPLAGTIPASFTSIAIPAGIAATIGANSAWYSLVNFNPLARLNQDITIFGIWMDALSCDVSPATPASQAAWGDVNGLGAAIVIGGRELPVGGEGVWTGGPCPIAGVESAVASVTGSVGWGRKMFSRTFPTGKLTVGTNKRGLNGSIVPFVRRIPRGESLTAALVLNNAQAVAGAGLTLNGYVDLEIYFGYTKNLQDLVE